MNKTAPPIAPAPPSKPGAARERPAAAEEDSDFAGWHVSSVELRQGLTVVDSDDPALHDLFGTA